MRRCGISRSVEGMLAALKTARDNLPAPSILSHLYCKALRPITLPPIALSRCHAHRDRDVALASGVLSGCAVSEGDVEGLAVATAQNLDLGGRVGRGIADRPGQVAGLVDRRAVKAQHDVAGL